MRPMMVFSGETSVKQQPPTNALLILHLMSSLICLFNVLMNLAQQLHGFNDILPNSTT